MFHYKTHDSREWFVELKRNNIDLKIEVRSKKMTYIDELPLEMYMTHTYKFFLKIENYPIEAPQPNKSWHDEQSSRSSGSERKTLYAQIQVIDSKTLSQVYCLNDPTKPIVEGTTLVEWPPCSAYSEVMKVKFLESNYSKKQRVSSMNTGINNFSPSIYMTPPPLTSSTSSNINNNSNINNDGSNGGITPHRRKRGLSSAPPSPSSSDHGPTPSFLQDISGQGHQESLRLLSPLSLENNNNNNNFAVSDKLNMVSSASSSHHPTITQSSSSHPSGGAGVIPLLSSEYKSAVLKTRLENMNREDYDSYCIRIVCFEFNSSPPQQKQGSNNRNNTDTDNSGATGGTRFSYQKHLDSSKINIFEDPNIVPIISKISAPFKIFSKRHHAKKKRPTSTSSAAANLRDDGGGGGGGGAQ